LLGDVFSGEDGGQTQYRGDEAQPKGREEGSTSHDDTQCSAQQDQDDATDPKSESRLDFDLDFVIEFSAGFFEPNKQAVKNGRGVRQRGMVAVYDILEGIGSGELNDLGGQNDLHDRIIQVAIAAVVRGMRQPDITQPKCGEWGLLEGIYDQPGVLSFKAFIGASQGGIIIVINEDRFPLDAFDVSGVGTELFFSVRGGWAGVV